MTTTTTLTCEADISSRYSTRAQACGKPATMAFITMAYDRTERVEARCATHAGALKRTKYAGGTLAALTPDLEERIRTRQAETKARRDAERAAKAEKNAILMAAARAEALEADKATWTAVRADEQKLDGWDGAAPIYRTVSRWEVRRDDGRDAFSTTTVKADRREDGWPVEITLSASSRLTRNEARALAQALLEATAE